MPAKPTALVVYFHGMRPGATDWTRVRERMGAEARWPAHLVAREGVHEATAADVKALFDFVGRLP